MPTIQFPYGTTQLPVTIPEENYAGTLLSKMHDYQPAMAPAQLVADALCHPIGTPRLSVMAENKQKVVIICSDHTRPVPSKDIIPQMLAEIRLGNPQADVTLLIATGCHRGTTREELIAKFGEAIVAQEKIVIHDCDDAASLVSLGRLPSGGELLVNKLAVEADLLVAEGFIEPHFFAGFSGGRKSILPGIASRKTVMYNHNGGFINSPFARTGVIDGNPIHEDMLYAARCAHLAFVVNVVINAQKQAIYAVAGDVDRAHQKGRDFLLQQCLTQPIEADIVISTNGGAPLDQNIYQSVKGMTAAEATVKKGGIIIMLASARDGHGGQSFYDTFVREKDLAAMTARFIATPPNETIPDQWESQILARVLQHADVYYISEAPDEMIRDFSMVPYHDLKTALTDAIAQMQSRGVDVPKVTAIPDGVSVVVRGN